MDSLILFGGTFDPIHNGHLNIAAFSQKQLKTDKVIFIPAKTPRWKDPISSSDRLKMLEAALKGKEDFIISHFELESAAPVNYSIETCRHFRRRYKDAKLYFLIGFDQVDNLDRWHEIEELAEIVEIVAVARPGYPRNHRLLKKYHIQVLECPEYSVSSTAVRELSSLDIPREVLEYILDHELYFTRSVEAYMSSDRYRHSVSTSWLSYNIASSNKLDPTPAFIAGYLHDIAKELPLAEQQELMEKHYKEYLNYPPFTYHQFLGEYLAKTYFKIKDERVLEAIKWHTSGKANMGLYAKILYAADKIEPTRKYDSSEMIAAIKENLEEGFLYVLKENQIYYQKHQMKTGKPLDETYNYYLKGESI